MTFEDSCSEDVRWNRRRIGADVNRKARLKITNHCEICPSSLKDPLYLAKILKYRST